MYISGVMYQPTQPKHKLQKFLLYTLEASSFDFIGLLCLISLWKILC